MSTSHGAVFRTLTVLLVLALSTAGCEEMNAPTGQSPEADASIGADEDPQRVASRQLARYLALALNDPEVREGLIQAMGRSPFSEGKVFFSTEFQGPLQGLIAHMAKAGSVPADEVRSLIRTSPNLEMYLPVSKHREEWNGGSGYLVATVLEEGATPFGVNPEGEEVPLSAESPPVTPTVVLVPAESFTAEGQPREEFLPSQGRQPSLTSEPIVCSTCSTSGGWSAPDDATWQRDIGIRERISHMRYHDQNEGWPNGQPEFYILLAGTDDTDSGAELTKRIEFPDNIWDGYDHEEDNWVLYDQQKLVDWDTDYGTRVRINPRYS